MAGGSVEHSNSVVTSWLGSINLGHEIFHAWNVKRIRGAEMWPYNYQTIEPGPSLWVAEGVTSYFEDLIALRAGIQGNQEPVDGIGPEHLDFHDTAENRFLQHLGAQVVRLENIPMRAFVSPADSSISDGMEYGAIQPSYYLSGEILGALLDLSILHDTKGERRLDDVMRTLYRKYYQHRRGYNTADLIKTVSEIAGKDYSPFFNNYVTGTAVPPYEAFFGFAGYKVVKSSRKLGNLGYLWAVSTADGRLITRPVDANSSAAKVGIKQGDSIVGVDGIPIHQVPLAGLAGKNWMGGWFVGKAGERVVLRIRHSDGKEEDLPVLLGTREESILNIEPDLSATDDQLRIRAKWLER
jgi:predicted metalloprotease with PDZ domain